MINRISAWRKVFDSLRGERFMLTMRQTMSSPQLIADPTGKDGHIITAVENVVYSCDAVKEVEDGSGLYEFRCPTQDEKTGRRLSMLFYAHIDDVLAVRAISNILVDTTTTPS